MGGALHSGGMATLNLGPTEPVPPDYVPPGLTAEEESAMQAGWARLAKEAQYAGRYGTSQSYDIQAQRLHALRSAVILWGRNAHTPQDTYVVDTAKRFMRFVETGQ